MIKYLKDGASPSGKAVGSGPTIRGFESLRSSQFLAELHKKQDSFFESNPSAPANSYRPYSERRASTGSFRDAERDGIIPAINVRITDKTIKNKAVLGSSAAESGISPVK